MHLVFENLIPNLTLLWTGKFKDFPPDDDFVLAPTVWDAIAEAGASSRRTIPSTFGAPIPNLDSERSHMTAETWSFWSTHLAPVLLRKRFRKDIYYHHFVRLVVLIKKCLQYKYTDKDINKIEDGFAEWVKEFERCAPSTAFLSFLTRRTPTDILCSFCSHYYRYNPSRLSCCTLTLHALLHIARDIRLMGPVWVYWAFAMECYCGRLSLAIKSRRFPWANLDHWIEVDALISHISAVYQLKDSDDMDLEPIRQRCQREVKDSACEYSVLSFPAVQGTHSTFKTHSVYSCSPSRRSLYPRHSQPTSADVSPLSSVRTSLLAGKSYHRLSSTAASSASPTVVTQSMRRACAAIIHRMDATQVLCE